MKEYRIICDQVKNDTKGHSWMVEQRYPLGIHGNPLTTVFKIHEEAVTAMEKWEQYGKAFEQKCYEINDRYPNLHEMIISQVNYRIQSREVSDWE